MRERSHRNKGEVSLRRLEAFEKDHGKKEYQFHKTHSLNCKKVL